MTVITSMEQLGKCIDDGVELELLDSANENAGLIIKEHQIRTVACWVNQGAVRTKPRTVDVRLYKNGKGEFYAYTETQMGWKPIASELSAGVEPYTTHTIMPDGE